ncbi:hypothetical protein E1292_13445 [Nonomuraea deserti]|uniref:Methylamine utilisation protein MauE domain-containing protein n=1 Tax=Nonomuraea deserti TaxID=1848322 RepID=A0A4R4VQP1_9ACTN|nr:MauE/DoxX family redox-associated membrane protein [Nonomuraea deserti]TDD07501.1 hypothetical protein E1292_13445 [Nonomuraea deserti]
MRLLPARWAPGVAAAVTGVELVTAGLLLTPWYAAGLALAAAALAVFAGVALVTRRRGLAVPCACFGPGPGSGRGGSARDAAPGGLPLGNPHAVRNTVLAAAALSGPFGGADASVGPVGGGLAGAAALMRRGRAAVLGHRRAVRPAAGARSRNRRFETTRFVTEPR